MCPIWLFPSAVCQRSFITYFFGPEEKNHFPLIYFKGRSSSGEAVTLTTLAGVLQERQKRASRLSTDGYGDGDVPTSTVTCAESAVT